MKMHLLTGDCFPLGKCCWNLCAQVCGRSGSRATAVVVAFCRGGGGLVFFLVKKFLDSCWETRFLLQNISSPGSTEIQTGVVVAVPQHNQILRAMCKTKSDVFIQLHCCKPLCCKRNLEPIPESVSLGVMPAALVCSDFLPLRIWPARADISGWLTGKLQEAGVFCMVRLSERIRDGFASAPLEGWDY